MLQMIYKLLQLDSPEEVNIIFQDEDLEEICVNIHKNTNSPKIKRIWLEDQNIFLEPSQMNSTSSRGLLERLWANWWPYMQIYFQH